jgi:aminoglycoside phosphotransferase (APT) family kinase protein
VNEPIASGREADIFALDAGRVLRRYRRVADVTREAAVMSHVAAHGYPVPAVHAAQGSDMVLERLDGPTMAQAMVAGEMTIPDGASLLAGLMERLHGLPPLTSGSIVHLDFHPENVMLTGRGPVVIDWCNATDGEPDLDLALSALMLAQVQIDRSHPWSAAAGEFLDAFLPLAPGDPVRLLDDAVVIKSGQSTITPEEIEVLGTAADRVRGDR